MQLHRLASATGAILLGAGVVLAAQPAAQAAFPGGNGLVAFVSTRAGSDTIFVVNPEAAGIGNGTSDPANTQQLTGGYSPADAEQGVDSEPFFSPNGAMVTFASDRNGNYQIFTIPVSDAGNLNSDGSDNATLVSQAPTDTGDDDYAPSFSPDGCTIVFNRGNSALYTVNSCATNPASTVTLLLTVSLVSNSGTDGSDSRALFDPVDPTKLIYVGNNNHIYELTDVGTPTFNPSQTPIDLSAASGVGSAADADPDWSPDGTQILFDSTRGGSLHQIWAMTSSGSAAAQVYTSTASDTQPVFSPDGTKIAFTEPGQSQDVADEAVMPVSMSGGLDHGSGTPTDVTLVGAGKSGPVDSQPDWQPVPGSSAVLPEAPYAILLPGGALLIMGLALALKRRRQLS